MRKVMIWSTFWMAVAMVPLAIYLLDSEAWVFAYATLAFALFWIYGFIKANWTTIMRWIAKED